MLYIFLQFLKYRMFKKINFIYLFFIFTFFFFSWGIKYRIGFSYFHISQRTFVELSDKKEVTYRCITVRYMQVFFLLLFAMCERAAERSHKVSRRISPNILCRIVRKATALAYLYTGCSHYLSYILYVCEFLLYVRNVIIPIYMYVYIYIFTCIKCKYREA